jgi:hypothetical protein
MVLRQDQVNQLATIKSLCALSVRLLTDATSSGHVGQLDRSKSTVLGVTDDDDGDDDDDDDDDDDEWIKDPLQLGCLANLTNLRRLHFELPVGIFLG